MVRVVRKKRGAPGPRGAAVLALVGLGLGLALLAALGVTVVRARLRAGAPRHRTAVARHHDFDTHLLASGQFESAVSTEIVCGLERVGAVGESTILSLVDEGKVVKRGDVLCEIDASAYEELLRRQTIVVEEARADDLRAELSLEVAHIGLRSFQEGEVVQTSRALRGAIALGQADVTRQEDRLVWTRRMLEKGYLPQAQVSTEEQTLRRAELSLRQDSLSHEIFQRFTVPKAVKVLQSAVNGARATLDYQSIRLKREEERLALYREMVTRCTVRAPHGGLVLHANRRGRQAEIALGATVRQRQRLFTLPDLSRMEVEVMLHETVVNDVRIGLPARVQSDALPGHSLRGEVTSIAPLPYADRRRESGNDVTYFVGRVRLAETLPELRPGMSAEVEILLGSRTGALAVPWEAVASEGRRRVCRVLRGDRLETRAVKLGRSNHEVVEVVDGLTPGEQVVLGTL